MDDGGEAYERVFDAKRPNIEKITRPRHLPILLALLLPEARPFQPFAALLS